MAKASVFGHWFAGPFMRAMQHIPVDRKAGAAAFDVAVRALKDGQVVGVFPEATISSSFTVKELKAGAARMAVQAGVPIIPAAVWGGHRIATKGHPVVLRRGVPVTVVLGRADRARAGGEGAGAAAPHPGGDGGQLLDEAQRSYPDVPAGDDDRWWQPAHLGRHRTHPGAGARAGHPRRARHRGPGAAQPAAAGPAPCRAPLLTRRRRGR